MLLSTPRAPSACRQRYSPAQPVSISHSAATHFNHQSLITDLPQVRAVLFLMLQIDPVQRPSSKEARDMLLMCLAAFVKIDPSFPTMHFMQLSDAAPDAEGQSSLLLRSIMPACVAASNMFLASSLQHIQIWLQYARIAFLAESARQFLSPGVVLDSTLLLSELSGAVAPALCPSSSGCTL
jgi:hypothetical protein